MYVLYRGNDTRLISRLVIVPTLLRKLHSVSFSDRRFGRSRCIISPCSAPFPPSISSSFLSFSSRPIPWVWHLLSGQWASLNSPIHQIHPSVPFSFFLFIISFLCMECPYRRSSGTNHFYSKELKRNPRKKSSQINAKKFSKKKRK